MKSDWLSQTEHLIFKQANLLTKSMRPNSKTYNPELCSSSRRAAYSTFQNKSRAQEVDKWGHEGFEQLELQAQLQNSKLSKSRRNNPDLTMASDSLKVQKNDKTAQNDKEKWTHDKYEEILCEEPKTKEQAQNQKPKREKRPDRALYSVRQKHSLRNEEMKKANESTVLCSDKLKCIENEKKEGNPSSPPLKTLGDKETEDDKLSISNVSTAMSDPLKSWEEESYTKNETKEKAESVEEQKEKEELEILFDIQLENENGLVSVRMYKGEEDYGAILDRLCDQQNLDPRTALYFKINMFEAIKEALGENDCEKLAIDLNNLLNVNYKLVMYENGIGEADESIAVYLEDNFYYDRHFLESLEDSIDE